MIAPAHSGHGSSAYICLHVVQPECLLKSTGCNQPEGQIQKSTMKLRQYAKQLVSIKGIMLSVKLFAISIQWLTPSSDYSTWLFNCTSNAEVQCLEYMDQSYCQPSGFQIYIDS